MDAHRFFISLKINLIRQTIQLSSDNLIFDDAFFVPARLVLFMSLYYHKNLNRQVHRGPLRKIDISSRPRRFSVIHINNIVVFLDVFGCDLWQRCVLCPFLIFCRWCSNFLSEKPDDSTM